MVELKLILKLGYMYLWLYFWLVQACKNLVQLFHSAQVK